MFGQMSETGYLVYGIGGIILGGFSLYFTIRRRIRVQERRK